MPWWDGRVLAILASAALFGVSALLATFHGERAGPVAGMSGMSLERSPPASGAPDDATARPLSPGQPREARSPVSAAPQQPGLRQRFEHSRDLYAFAQSIAPAVDRGEPEALWLMGRVVDTCAGHAADPAGFARDTARLEDMRLAGSQAMGEARARVHERCRRFAANDGLSGAVASRYRMAAADAGSLAAEAELLGMGRPLAGDADYASDLVGRVRDSLDAEAFSAISPAMGGSAGLGVFAQADIAPQFRELAWQLAACRLGLDCSPDGALMTSYCVNGGICSHDARQGFEEFVYDAAVPRQSADLVRGMVDTLAGRNGG